METTTERLIECLEDAIKRVNGDYGPNTLLARMVTKEWQEAIDAARAELNAPAAAFVRAACGEPPTADESETVPEGWGCPSCGEQRMDYLIQNDEDAQTVTCFSCGEVYTVDAAPAHDPRNDDYPMEATR